MVAFVLLEGCGQTQTTAASWAFALVKCNNHLYKVTDESVSTVARLVGTVTNYSDNESAIENGTFSNTYPVGTKLFSIPNTDKTVAIAAQTKDGSYLKAGGQDTGSK